MVRKYNIDIARKISRFGHGGEIAYRHSQGNTLGNSWYNNTNKVNWRSIPRFFKILTSRLLLVSNHDKNKIFIQFLTYITLQAIKQSTSCKSLKWSKMYGQKK